MSLYDKKTFSLNYGVLYTYIFVLAVAVIGAISVCVLLARKGDERRKTIIKKTSHKAFITAFVVMLINFIYQIKLKVI